MAVFVWYKVSEVSRIGRKMLKYNYLKLTHVMLARIQRLGDTCAFSVSLFAKHMVASRCTAQPIFRSIKGSH